MKHKSFFLISPKIGLIERINQSGLKSLSDLADLTLWSYDESDRSIMRRSDADELVKILFVDLIKRERSSDAAFLAVFGDVSASASFFDSNWSMSRVALDMTVEDAIEDSIQSGSVSAFLPSGNERLDEVIGEYQKRVRRL